MLVGLKENEYNDILMNMCQLVSNLNSFNIPSNVCIDVVIGNDQEEQEHSQNIGENSQLNVGDHAKINIFFKILIFKMIENVMNNKNLHDFQSKSLNAEMLCISSNFQNAIDT